MNTKQKENDAMSSKRQPTLQCLDARAPSSSLSCNVTEITEEELAGLSIRSPSPISVVSQHSVSLVHVEGECNHLSVCSICISLKKIIKLMRKLPHNSEQAVEAYYLVLGKMPTHQYCARIAQDELTLAKQTIVMRSQISRGYKKYHNHIGSSYRANMLRVMLSDEHSDKRMTKSQRMTSRDLKYEFESDFVAQGACMSRASGNDPEYWREHSGFMTDDTASTPIEHERGNCNERYSMCDDCCSLGKVHAIADDSRKRADPAYGLFWRIIERVPTRLCDAIVWETGQYLPHLTIQEINTFLLKYFIYAPPYGGNEKQQRKLFDMFHERRNQMMCKDIPIESPFVTQAIASIDVNFPSLDRITDLLNRMITANHVNVDPTLWSRRLTSFILMIMQLCAQSSLFIKITAVAQFMTHLNLPSLGTLRGYAQQLAQVFQAAVERIRFGEQPRQQPDFARNLMDDYGDEDEDEVFRAQGDAPLPEGFIVGTAKLMCAMAGLTDYDIKANTARVSRLDQLSRTIVSTERLAHFVAKLFKYAYDSACEHIYGVHPDMRELALVSERIPVWMDQVTDYYNAEGMMRVTKNLDEARQVMKWHKTGDEYNALLWKFKVVPKAYAIFKNVYNMCDKMYQAATPYLADSAMRVSPFTLLITGGPGLGKSTMQYSLITDLLTDSFRRRGRKYEPGSQIHVHYSGGKFWDGYNEQAAVVADDVFQSQDPTNTIDQCMDICRMKNMVTWPVPKADLASKGTTFMVSELLVMTGNVGVPSDISRVIRSFEAIRRRIDMLIHQTIIPEYLDSSGRLNKRKVAVDFPMTYVEGLAVSADITSIMRFDVEDNQGRIILKNGSYKQLLTLAIEMKQWEKEHEEAIIRANYLRAGLDVHGKEKPFVAQMWSSRPPQVREEYVDELLFQSDIDHINGMLEGRSVLPKEGFLTEEERLEIFATVSQRQEPDPTWGKTMKRAYEKVKRKASDAGTRFGTALGNFVDNMRSNISDSTFYKVGQMVIMAVSVVSLGFLSYRVIKSRFGDNEQDEIREVWKGAETSGDERTRKTTTHFAENTSGDERTRQTRTHFAENTQCVTKMVHGRKWVAIKSNDRETRWVPEARVREVKPIKLPAELWTDADGDKLPQDVISVENGQMITQACPDRNAYNIGVNKITNNAVMVDAFHDDRVVSTLRGLFIYGRVLMLPRHLFHGLDEQNTELVLTTSTGIKMKLNTSECTVRTPKEEMDLIFLRLPKRFQCFTDIRSHFHSMEGLNKHTLREAMLWTIDGENNAKLITLCSDIEKDKVLSYVSDSYSSATGDKTVHLVKSYTYRGVTLAGHCGSPLIWMNPSIQCGHILGVHVAGTNLRGLTTPVTKEFLYSFLADWDDISIIVPPLDPVDGVMTAQSKRAVSQGLGLAHYGRVSPQNQVRIPTETAIIQSPLYGVFPIVTGPAVLRATAEMNPLRTGILKQKVPLVIFPQHLVDEATKHLAHSILSAQSPYTQIGNLSVDEALNGIPGDKWIPPMNLHTSPGYPYVLGNTSKNGKFDFVTGEPGDRELKDIVMQKLLTRISEAQDGVVSMTLFMDILKDERVKLEKVKVGKTRIFNVAPFDLNIAVRMYFQTFAAHIMYNHVYDECAVGLNPHSDEWGMMFYHLQHAGPNWIGGDYSNYDKQLSYQLLKSVLKIINEFYGDDDERVRECLFETIFSAFHIAERDVYRVPQGNPSGIAMTSIINSLVNSLMMRIVYLELGGNLSTFDENVRLKTYGDDNIAAVSDRVPWFNMVTISKKLAEYGVVYNQPNKTAMDESKPYMTTDELTFLKRAFRVSQGRVLAPLHIDSITEMINWIRKSNDDAEAMRANFLAACREMYHHGAEAFEVFRKHVYAFAHKRAFRLPYTDYVTSGQYWGVESADHVNLTIPETAHGIEHCYGLENEEVLFRAQSIRAPRQKEKAVRPSLLQLLILVVIIKTTANNQGTIMPTENTSGPTVNADNATTRTQITTFSDTSMVTLDVPQDVPSIPMTPVDPYMKQTLIEYLSRVYYDTYTWKGSAYMGDLLAQITFPNFLFSVPQIWDKLKNFAYFRAGVKIGIRINGSKFHYGQLLVSYSPQFNNTLDLQPATNNIYSASGCPCFMISPSENEVHEFILPYALPYQYIPMYNVTSTGTVQGDPAFQFGVVNIYCLNSLSLGPTLVPPVSFTVFANFVDVDIAGYSPVAYTIPVRQFNDQSTLPAIRPGNPIPPTSAPTADPLVPYVVTSIVPVETPFVAQGRNTISKEQKTKSEKGVVGRTLESVTAIAGALIPIPEIGEIAAGVATVSGIGASIANFFGWTNPISLIAIQPAIQQYANLVNTHGLNDSQNLALAADSIVSPSTELLGGSGYEMTIKHIAQTPCLLAAGINWDNTQAPNTSLYEVDLSPIAEFYDPAKNIQFPTLLSWVSRACLYWRGSLKYHLQIVCSQMHVGRIRIAYIPNPTGNVIRDLDSNQNSSLGSMVLDIQQQTSMSFTIPYLTHRPWLPVQGLSTVTDSPPQTFGRLRISVLNELNHPTTPVPSVFLNLWVSAGPDFQLARPDGDFLRGNWYRPTTETPFVAQGLTRQMIREMPAPPLIPAIGSMEHEICNADEVNHIKDFIMRPCWIGSLSDTATPGYTPSATVNPYAPVQRYSPGSLLPNQNSMTYLEYFRLVYRFSRGGHRVVCQALNPNTPNYILRRSIQNTYFASNGLLVAVNNNSFTLSSIPQSYCIVNGAKNGQVYGTDFMPMTATIPYYSTLYGVTNAATVATGTPTTTAIFSQYGWTPGATVATNGGDQILLAAADDYELMFLVGPPCLTPSG
jgi:hypothetical protein